MKPNDPVERHADHDITVLPADLTPEEAASVLVGTGVVVADGAVLGTATAAELGRATGVVLAEWTGLPRAVVAADQTVAQLADSSAMALLALGAPRLVFERAGIPVAVLDVAVVADYLASGAHPLPAKHMGPLGGTADGSLPGKVRLAAATVRCAVCGHRNSVDHWNPRRPPRCGNPDREPHDLALEA